MQYEIKQMFKFKFFIKSMHNQHVIEAIACNHIRVFQMSVHLTSK